MKTCGTCTLCCKLLGVVELEKPANQKCAHCKPGQGCAIYNDRPHTCQAFRCLWLDLDGIPDDQKPEKVHCVVWLPPENDNPLSADIIVQEDPLYYALGQSRERIPALIELFDKQRWTVCFVNGNQRRIVYPGPRKEGVL